MKHTNPHQHGMAPDSAFRRMMGDDLAAPAAGDGVQEHSKGDIYPCVIFKRERYADLGPTANARDSLASRERGESHVLLFQGKEAEYATHADAEQVAHALLESAAVRLAWHRGES